MVAHIGHWTAGSGILLGAFLALLAFGVAFAVVGRRSRSHTPISLAFIGAGLAGAIVVAVTAGPGTMHLMMGGGMGSMMQSGETGRTGSAPVAGAREVAVESREFSFDPAEVRLDAGEAVNVRFRNEGHMFHTFTVGELGLELRAEGGDEIVGSIRAERAGTYGFLCTVAGHAESGMRGTVMVEA